jgi:hypothetical protein
LFMNARSARLRQPEPRRERARTLAPSQSNRFVNKSMEWAGGGPPREPFPPKYIGRLHSSSLGLLQCSGLRQSLVAEDPSSLFIKNA